MINYAAARRWGRLQYVRAGPHVVWLTCALNAPKFALSKLYENLCMLFIIFSANYRVQDHASGPAPLGTAAY